MKHALQVLFITLFVCRLGAGENTVQMDILHGGSRTGNIQTFINQIDGNNFNFGAIEVLRSENYSVAPLTITLDRGAQTFNLHVAPWFNDYMHQVGRTEQLDPFEKFNLARAYFRATYSSRSSCFWPCGWHPEVSSKSNKILAMLRLLVSGGLLSLAVAQQYMPDPNKNDESTDQINTGWIPLFFSCASGMLLFDGLSKFAKSYGMRWYRSSGEREQIECAFDACKHLTADDIKTLGEAIPVLCDRYSDEVILKLQHG